MRVRLALAVMALLATPALAKQPPRAVSRYTDCVNHAFRHPGAEKGSNFEEAQELAKVQCGNLRNDAVAAMRRTITRRMTQNGDDPETAAQAMIDIVILEQTAGIWAEWHPNEIYHGR